MLFTFLTFMFYENNDDAGFRAMVGTSFMDNDDDDDAAKLIELYAKDEHHSPTEKLADIMNDAYFQHGVERYNKNQLIYFENINSFV